MTKHFLAAGLLVGTVFGVSADLQACGDKFLIGSRGTRFQHPPSATAGASILVFANPTSNLPKALANVPVDATLRKAGYKPTTVTTANDFDAALSRGGWDLVLVDVADGPAVSVRVAGVKAPVVLPVVYNATDPQLVQAKKQYQTVLKSPTKSQPFLDAIDDALALRVKPSGKAAAKSGN